MMGLVEALGKAMPAFAGSDWYGILDLFANTAFTFLPILIAVSAARVFGGNIFLGAVIGMIMIHPNLINAWSVASMDAADIPVWHLFGFSIRQVGYQGHVIPVIIAVWIMCKLENWLHKHVPEMIDLFVTPLCTVLITGFLTIGLIGPVFSTAETYVLEFASWIITVGHGIGAMIMGAIYPLTVVCGIHHMYNVIEAGMLASDGLNIWMPIASAANFAQGAACLAVGLKARNYKTKSISIPSALSAALGITEPAIFGVNLRFMKPLVCGMAGGAVGALLGSIFHIGATSYGVTGIPGFLTTLDYSAQYAIMLAVSFAVSFALTWFTWKEDPEDAKVTVAKTDDAPAAEPTATEETAEEVTVDGTAKKLYAPIQGTIVPRNEIPDDTFAAGVLGDGVGIDPEEGVVVAPFDGEISSVTDTKHAIGITGPADMEVLIHVGVDTVNMKGDGFELLVEEGQKVKAGQKLMTFDIAKIKAAGYSPVAAVLLTNSDDYPEFKVVKTGKTKRLEEVFTV